jgi:hypothetical protein
VFHVELFRLPDALLATYGSLLRRPTSKLTFSKDEEEDNKSKNCN